jgi:chromosome segregation ATPase
MQDADWMRMLEQLRDALQQTAGEVTRHEQTLASPLLSTDLGEERQVSWRRALERFADRIQESQAHVDLARQDAERAQIGIAEQEESLAEFRARLAKSRAQLAKLPTAV